MEVEKKGNEETVEEKSEETTMLDINAMPMTELYTLYAYVSGQANTTSMSLDSKTKEVIRNRQAQIEEELSRRAFGFVLSKRYTVAGRKPEDVIKSAKFVNLKEEKV